MFTITQLEKIQNYHIIVLKLLSIGYNSICDSKIRGVIMNALKTEQIIVRLTIRQKQKLKKIADKKEMTMSEYVRLLIEKEINGEN
jgi:hypothetical protein